MIPELFIGLVLAVAPTQGETPPERKSPVKRDPAVEQAREPLDVLIERMLGKASKPVRFDWRKTTVGVAVIGSHLAELNNFDSRRAGLLLRLPSSTLVTEVGFTKVWTFNTPSSRKLAKTPYRQPGRPNRYEIDIAVELPLAEGVVTAWPGFFPATQLVFSLFGNFRYVLYPAGFEGMGFRDTAGRIFSPRITDRERTNLEDERLASMQIDSARYGLLLGLGTDVYFHSGFFVSPRIMTAVPLLAPMTGTDLKVWWDFSLALGMAF